MEVCRLCLDLATESDVKKLEGTYRDATQIVLPEVNTDISSSPVICQQCTSSLDELYTFKASVVEAENQIKEKVGDDKCQLRLKEVMTGVQMDEKNADLGKSKDRMCRTCLCAIEGETFTVLKPSQSDAYLNSMLLMCLPEMDLELTLDPVMCEQCLCNLQKLYHFKSSCLDVEERLNNYCQQHGTSSASQINLHSVLEEDAAEPKDNIFGAVKSEPIDSSVKSEEDDEDVSMSDNSKDLGYTVVKVKKEERDMMLKEEDDTEDGDESMGDDADNMSDEEIGELKQEELKIEDDDGDGTKKVENMSCSEIAHSNMDKKEKKHRSRRKVTFYKCEHCEFTTKRNVSMKSHTERLHSKAELPLLKCGSCAYSTRIEVDFRKHFTYNHRECEVLKCEYCPYTSYHKDSFRSHVRKKHKNIIRCLEKCAHCEYATSDRSTMRVHVARRHNHGELPLLKCDLCNYITPIKSNLGHHIRYNHTTRPLFKCEYCDYTSKYTSGLKVHVARNHERADLPMLKCDQCDYTSQIQHNLRKHFKWFHKKMPVFKCDQCPYTTKYSGTFRRHVWTRHCNAELPPTA